MRGIDATISCTQTPTSSRNRGDKVAPVRLQAEIFEELTLRALRREKLPVTVEGKAELFKLNRDTLRRLGKDTYEPTLGTAMHIARVLGTKVEKLWSPAGVDEAA